MLKKIKSTVTILEKGIVDQAIESTDLKNTLRIIYKGKVPDQWLKSIITNLSPLIEYNFFYYYLSVHISMLQSI